MEISETVIHYYDPQAETYFEKFANEVDQKPYDREFLDRFAKLLPSGGRVLDIGCSSSAQQANYLSKQFSVSAIDLAPRNIEIAARNFPHIQFHAMDMRQLKFEPLAFDGVCAFYSLIHIPTAEVGIVLDEFHRVLKANGKLALAVHEGTFEGILEEQKVFFKTFSMTELTAFLRKSGFEILSQDQRPPIYDFEYQSQRLYVIARAI